MSRNKGILPDIILQKMGLEGYNKGSISQISETIVHKNKTFIPNDSNKNSSIKVYDCVNTEVTQKNLILTESILVPYKNALELARIAETIPGDISLYINENQCALIAGDIYITSRLISGTFPDYEQIIPKEYKTHTTMLV